KHTKAAPIAIQALRFALLKTVRPIPERIILNLMDLLIDIFSLLLASSKAHARKIGVIVSQRDSTLDPNRLTFEDEYDVSLRSEALRAYAVAVSLLKEEDRLKKVNIMQRYIRYVAMHTNAIKQDIA
ncbi:MAG: hypothetical protein CUN55_20155, partial [Phototrophicales bacterium]